MFQGDDDWLLGAVLLAGEEKFEHERWELRRYHYGQTDRRLIVV